MQVSIPNGTITGEGAEKGPGSIKGFNSKRYDYRRITQDKGRTDARFQFQTVRLQDTVTEKVPADGFSFNSKRYDYRVDRRAKYQSPNKVSIPNGTITGNGDTLPRLYQYSFNSKRYDYRPTTKRHGRRA